MDQVTADNLTWLIREYSDDRLGPEPHEEGFAKMFQALCGKNGVFMDIGAHVGHWTLRMARWCREVYAIEPYMPAREHLVANLAENAIQNVAIYSFAAFDRIGFVRFRNEHGKALGASTYISELANFSQGEDWVPAMPIDNIGLVVPRLDLVKIDVEGTERQVLAGMRKLLARYRPAVFVEIHDGVRGLSGLGEEVRVELATSLYRISEKFHYGDCEYVLAQYGGPDVMSSESS